MRKIRLAVFLISLFVCLCSCNKNLIQQSEQERYPDLVLKDAKYSFGRSGDHPITFTADEVVIYSDYTQLKNVTFDSPEAFISGHCDDVTVTDDNNLAKLKGNVRLVKSDDDVIIECNQLDWDNKEGLITCKEEVELNYGGGTYIRAIGFSGHTKSNGYVFERILEGRYTNEK